MCAAILPPADLAVEQALLGLLMCGSGGAAPAFLGSEHFADPVHGVIFDAIEHVRHTPPADFPTALREHFAATGELEEVGGLDYLSQLRKAGQVPTGTIIASLVNRHARTIHSCWVRCVAIDPINP